MSSVVISGDTSGAVTILAPAVAGTNTLTLQAGTGTNSMNTLATAVTSTSGTSIDFTSLPSWIKRITVMFSGVSTNGTSNIILQLGDAGGIETTGYLGSNTTSTTQVLYTNGLGLSGAASAASIIHGVAILALLDSATATWAMSWSGARSDVAQTMSSASSKVLSAAPLDRVRITTANGTDTFDAGTVNILYEG